MARSLGLLGSIVTTRQRIIVGAWYVALIGIVVMWLVPALTELIEAYSFAELLHAFGLLFGLLAAYFALTQFMLMGRLLWIERTFGADHLAGYHRINGYLTIIFIILHPILIVFSHSLLSGQSYAAEYATTLMTYAFTPLALLGEILFVAVVISSIYIARKHLAYEWWYGIHLLVYIAIVVSFFHQTIVGDTFVGHPVNTLVWNALYGFVALNILFFRVIVPVYDQFSRNFVVTKVVPESPTVTSLYITGRNMASWRVKPGQFVYLRIFQGSLWIEEHPFSLSQLPDASGTFRVSIRASGDYTRRMTQVNPGSRIAVSRAFGKFTADAAVTGSRLYVAGGIGITPIVTLARESVDAGIDSVLVYGNTAANDVPLTDDIAALAQDGLTVHEFFNQDPVAPGAHKGYVTAERIAELVKDYAERDIYICGPPVMMYGLVDQLLALGVDESRLHYERFALHDQKKAAPKPVTRPVAVPS